MKNTHDVMSPETKMAINYMKDDVQELKDCLSSFVDKELFRLEMRTINEKLEAIHIQTKKTNGRVTKHDEFINTNKEMIKDIRKERSDRYRKAIDWGWRIVFTIGATALGIDKLRNIF